ncbi:MAG: TraB/GumN family protein [Cellvibrionaceae bacterium]
MNIFSHLLKVLERYKQRKSFSLVVFFLLFISLTFPSAVTAKETARDNNESIASSQLPANEADSEQNSEPNLELTCPDPSSSLLWTIKGTKSTVHLFGSIHIGAKGFYPLDKKIEKIFRKSDYLVFEVNPQTIADPKNAIEIQTRSLLPNNETIDKHVSANTVSKVKKALTNFGLPADSFMVYKPWFITMLLTNMQVMSMGYMPQYGVEQYLLREKAEATDVLELETFISQLELMESLDGEAFLSYTLANLEKSKTTIRELIHAWQCGDKKSLEGIFSSEFDIDGSLGKQFDTLEKKLLFDRNIIMTNGIEKFLREGTGIYFVVVGAAHYVGKNSVVQMLEKKGFNVNNIKL